MNESPQLAVCFALVLPQPKAWFTALSTAFKHPWVLSYQVGFGPPLIRAHDRLITAVRQSRSALEKLEAYLNHCYLDDEQRKRLSQQHRRLLVRSFGPVEAEAIRTASRDVLDLTVQLYSPQSAPESVKSEMRKLGVTGPGPDDPPEDRSGRFWLHLSDPRNTRLMEVDAVRSSVRDSDREAVLALTTPSVAADLYGAWFEQWVPALGCSVVRLEGPVSVARAYRDGVSI